MPNSARLKKINCSTLYLVSYVGRGRLLTPPPHRPPQIRELSLTLTNCGSQESRPCPWAHSRADSAGRGVGEVALRVSERDSWPHPSRPSSAMGGEGEGKMLTPLAPLDPATCGE